MSGIMNLRAGVAWLLLALSLASFCPASSAPVELPADGTAILRPQGRNLRQAGGGPPLRKVCHDSCSKARNGVCEEGRPGKAKMALAQHVMAYCDLGTDCEDCGPWLTSAPDIPWEDPRVVGPVKYLKIRDVQVRVREAAVAPSIPFVFAYTDPQHDYDVSYHMDSTGVLEAGISMITFQLLSKRCLREDGTRALVVDVGANFGWFTVMAARMGCRVIAYEPVPLFRSFFEYNIHLNDLSNLIEVRTSLVSHETGKNLTMVVPTRGIWGTAGIDGLNIDKSIQSDHSTIEVPSVRLEDEIKSDVLLMKVDVEGWEWSVMRGAEGLLRDYNVENIVMEYSPGVPERHFKWDHMLATPTMLADLISKYGYRIAQIGDAGKHLSSGWNATIGPLREVAMDNLKYDIEDVKKWQAGQLACPVPPGMTAFPNWQMCGGVPEGLSPRSFRSDFAHNTNIWATKATPPGPALALMNLQGRSGILDPSDPPEKYFQTNANGWGMASRVCQGMDPQWQVKHRCRCADASVCGEEEETILRAAAAGMVAQNYVLS